jgi:putative acetyltransferase
MLTFGRESPLGADLALLHARHMAAMHADTPPESIHMLPPAALAAPEVAFFVMRREGEAIGMGALKRIDPGHAEVKSMHVLAEWRGQGLARRLLDLLVREGRAAGFARLSLETGSQPSFAAARGLYGSAGFVICPPFEGYGPDPNSVFMTRRID